MIEQHRPPAVRGYSLIQTGLPVEKMYVYRGDGTDQLEDEYLRVPLEKPRAERRKPKSVCGTNGGYRAHRKRGEEACDDCLAARRERKRQERAKKSGAEK